ncbi:hypothetical protein BG015_004972 [Linnemannia schmuckeri]|uniref:F-box domain-containing protein n=1 Tax=Linnemannia schmuckeri TaxID=64567 RepID=A0A9P5S3Z2_9FUNG|nr:hypothetical protein BG015_004972 [Linnemannia schmuckeri]
MSPPLPSVTFFQLPELASLLSTFLRASDISNLMQTSQKLHTLFHPCFWYHLELVSEEQVIRLIKSPDAFAALVNNFDRIRSLKITLVFLCFQYVAAQEYMEQQYSNNDPSVAELPVPLKLAKPAWHSNPNYRSQMQTVQPLPLFTHLNRLHVNLESLYGGRYLSFAINMYNTSPLVLTVCWLVGLNPGLTDLRIHGVDVPTPLSIRVLARSISRLHNLKHLELKGTTSSRPTFYDVAKVFFVLPPSIVSFKWKGELIHFAPIPDLNVSHRDLDWDEGILVERREPLQSLKVLELPSDTTGYLHSQLKHIFSHCPMVEALEFPFVNPDENDCYEMVDVIKANCPRIRRVFVKQKYRDGRGHCVLGVTESLPRQQLETFHYTGIQDDSPGRLGVTMTKHSVTLRRIVLREAIQLQSNGIQEILASCRVLEHLEISGMRHSRLAITLTDATLAPWVCSNLKYLGLAVNLGDYNRPQGGMGEEQRRWAALEMFYRNLGTLTKLEILDLKSVAVRINPTGNEFDLTPESRIFPRLLILDDKAINKRGYLTMLKGLKELRELRGSVRLDAMDWSLDSSATVGQAEVEWMASNWRHLRLATFLPDNHDKFPAIDVPEYLRWLQTQLPDLRLSRQFQTRYRASPIVSSAISAPNPMAPATCTSRPTFTTTHPFTSSQVSVTTTTSSSSSSSSSSSGFTTGPASTAEPASSTSGFTANYAYPPTPTSTAFSGSTAAPASTPPGPISSFTASSANFMPQPPFIASPAFTSATTIIAASQSPIATQPSTSPSPPPPPTSQP